MCRILKKKKSLTRPIKQRNMRFVAHSEGAKRNWRLRCEVRARLGTCEASQNQRKFRLEREILASLTLVTLTLAPKTSSIFFFKFACKIFDTVKCKINIKFRSKNFYAPKFGPIFLILKRKTAALKKHTGKKICETARRDECEFK